MNWGTKLTIGMILFMAFIVTLVFMMLGPHKADSLIETDYYEKGQMFDLDYNAKQRAKADEMLPVIVADAEGLKLNFPAPVSYQVTLRRLSDAALDKNYRSNSAQKSLIIPAGELKSGSWLLRIQYNAKGKDYLFQDKVIIP